MNNTFSLDYLRSFITKALERGYTFYTVKAFLKAGSPREKAFVLKHDLDARPETLPAVLGVEKDCGVRSTIYTRTTANEYNVLSYRVLPMLIEAECDGFELGLHSNFLEYAIINHLDPLHVLKTEVQLLKQFLNVRGMSTHRDLNYAYNALPWLEVNWDAIKDELDLDYQAYDRRLMDGTIYVNEGYSPHLCWRGMTPFEAIETGKSIYMLTHNHWWYKTHPFE